MRQHKLKWKQILFWFVLIVFFYYIINYLLKSREGYTNCNEVKDCATCRQTIIQNTKTPCGWDENGGNEKCSSFNNPLTPCPASSSSTTTTTASSTGPVVSRLQQIKNA
jgi:hypothetical protein